MVFQESNSERNKTLVNSYFSDSARHRLGLLPVSLWSLDEPDPRVDYQVKGPDLSVCQKLRRKANLHGADEAVILDAHGNVAGRSAIVDCLVA